MVSTRNAAPLPVPTRQPAKRKGRTPAARGVNPAAPAPRASNNSTSQHRPDETITRKRDRNGSPGADGAPSLLPNSSKGERTSKAKRAKTQPIAEEKTARTRKATEHGARQAPAEIVDPSLDAASNLEQTQSGVNTATMMTYNDIFENRNGLHGDGEISMGNPAGLFSQGLEIRTQSLPVLDNFATQILSVMAKSSYQELSNITTNIQTGISRQWSQLNVLFCETKKVYAIDSAFLSTQGLGLSGKAQVDTIKKANLATFVCALFGGGENVGLNNLNEWFLDIFVADDTKMLKSHAQLFIDLKTQAYISAVTSNKQTMEESQHNKEYLLNALFPPNLGQLLLDRRSGAGQLTSIERQFVEQARTRSDALLQESHSVEAIEHLPAMYSWEEFLREVHNYIKRNFDDIMGRNTSVARRPGRPRQEQTTFRAAYGNQSLPPQQLSGLGSMHMQPPANSTNDIAEKAARAAHFAMEAFGSDAQANPANHSLPQRSLEDKTSFRRQTRTPQASGPPIQFHFERPLHPNVPSPPAPFFAQSPYQNGQMQGQWHTKSNEDGLLHQSYESESTIPYPTQSAPTHVLYERARQAASSKSSQQQAPRKSLISTPTQRRPWTPDEENALMAGLDRVKGPHWSQIHAMFGPNGTINDVLKDRNQVQLKDKARNLKLFFLKSNIEVPYYLQFVTGELKTRAPSRVAKNEARQRVMSDEDRAHVQGVMTLAGSANNALQEQEGDDNNNLEDSQSAPNAGEPSQQINMPGAAAAANDINIDPSLEAQLRQAATGDTPTDPALPGPGPGPGRLYVVPTPNMLMQSLDKFNAASADSGSGARSNESSRG